MVFDNCQIDVFFHMRSHYNRLKNVRSVVDSSAPKGFKRFSHSETSCKYAVITNPASFGMKKHNCCYGRCPCNAQKRSAKDPHLRPSTRRHLEDLPSASETYTESHRESSLDSSHSKRSSMKRTNHDTKTIPENNYEKIVIHTSHEVFKHKVVLQSPNASSKNVLKDPEPQELDLNQSDNPKSKESLKYNTPVTSAEEKERDPVDSAKDHEYLQFLLRITEDIIKNDLYTNREMKRAFISHINANKERLSLDRMLLHIYELMRELSVSFTDDGTESIPSWTNIEAAMKGLICINKNEDKEPIPSTKIIETKYKSTPDSERDCVCSQLKTLDQCFPLKKQIIEDFQSHLDEDYDSVNTFQYSLDRLTERTEPMSSQATCKVSSTTACSSFGDVGVLPGFENLETPTCSKNMMKKDFRLKKPPKIECVIGKKSSPTGQNKKNKSKPPKFVTKCTRKSKEFKRIAETSTEDLKLGSSSLEISKTRKLSISKPILISLQERQDPENSNILNISSSGHNYVLVPGLIYIMKEFLDKNPTALMTINIPSLPISSHVNDTTDATDGEDSNEGKMKDLLDKISENSIENINDNIEQIDEEIERKKVHILAKPLLKQHSTESLEIKEPKDATTSTYPVDFPNASDDPPFFLKQSETLESDYGVDPETPHPEDFERNLLTNEYDLTPQKDNEFQTTSGLMGEKYVIRNTDDNNTHDLAAKETEPQNENQQSTSVDKSEIPPEEIAPQKVSGSSDIDKDDISAEEELNSPLNFSAEELRRSTSNEIDDNLLDPKQTSVEKIPIENTVDSLASDGHADNASDILSVATIERTNQLLDDIEEKIPHELAMPLYQEIKFRNDRFGSDEDSEVKEVAHQRKVSILKNPINQVPIEKIFGEIDDTKKKGESIKKAVENLKDRQTNRDHFITRAMQDMESSRLSEKVIVSSDTPTPTPAPIIHSSLKGHAKISKPEDTTKTPELDKDKKSNTEEVIMTSSDEKLSVNRSPSKQTSTIDSANTVASSEFLPELDERPNQKLLANQRKAVNSQAFNVGTFSDANEKKDDELTIMLDQLVDAFKKQQEMEDEIKREDVDHREEESEEVEHKKGFTWCGLCKKKKTTQVKPFREPVTSNNQAPFSEENYKAKSEAFESALASLGHKSATQQGDSSTEINEPIKSSARDPSPILHSGNRLSLVRIADHRDSDYAYEISESDTTMNRESR